MVKVYSAFSYIRVQEAFDSWKSPEFSLYSELEYSSIQGYLDEESISFARGLLDFEKQQVLKYNPLNKYLEKTLTERAMPRASLFKLFEDLEGNFWFTGFNGDLTLYKDGAFQPFKHNDELKKGYRRYQIPNPLPTQLLVEFPG